MPSYIRLGLEITKPFLVKYVADCTSGSASSSANCSAGNHQLTEHTATSSTNIDAKCRHKTIDLLAYLEKCYCTQEPDEDVTCNFFPAGCCNSAFYFTFLNGKRWCNQRTAKEEYCDGKHHVFFQFHIVLLSQFTTHTDRGLAKKVPTIETKSRRHQAFIMSRKNCPPNIRHQELKIFDVFSDAPVANAIGAVNTRTPTIMYRSAASKRSLM